MNPLSGSGRLVRRINSQGVRSERDTPGRVPEVNTTGNLTSRTTRGTFQRPLRRGANVTQPRQPSVTPRWL